MSVQTSVCFIIVESSRTRDREEFLLISQCILQYPKQGSFRHTVDEINKYTVNGSCGASCPGINVRPVTVLGYRRKPTA